MKTILAIVALVAAPFAASAASLGVGIGGATGSNEDTDGFYDYDETSAELDFVANFGSFDRMFNWRLQAGLISGDSDSGRATRSDREYDGLIIGNAASFRLNSAEYLRIWLGPAFTLGFLDFGNDGPGNGDAVMFTLGPALGFDMIGVHGAPTISLQIAAQFGTLSHDESFLHDEDVSRVMAHVALLWGR